MKGTRLSVDFILDLLVNNWSYEEILENYPQINSDDIKACLEYASQIIKDEKVKKNLFRRKNLFQIQTGFTGYRG